MNLSELTDEVLAELSREAMTKRAELKVEARAIQDEQDRRAIVRKLNDIDPKGLVIKPRGIESGEKVGTPGAG